MTNKLENINGECVAKNCGVNAPAAPASAPAALAAPPSAPAAPAAPASAPAASAAPPSAPAAPASAPAAPAAPASAPAAPASAPAAPAASSPSTPTTPSPANLCVDGADTLDASECAQASTPAPPKFDSSRHGATAATPAASITPAAADPAAAPRPTFTQLRRELAREKRKNSSNRTLKAALRALVLIAACTVLAATQLFPVLQISGTSMSPTLDDGQVVLALKGSNFKSGDVVAINYGSRVLVKRVIAGAGDWVDITEDGTVYVNGIALSEDYIDENSLGKCDITLPYQVPDDSWFVMGDHRETSVDSRTSSVGAIATSDILGKILMRVWPLGQFGGV